MKPIKTLLLTLTALLMVSFAFGLSYDFGNGGEFTYSDVSDIDFYEESWLEFDGDGDYVFKSYNLDRGILQSII